MPRLSSLPLVVCVGLAAASSGCTNPATTYASPRAGYELRMPEGFIAPREHDQFHMDDSVLGPMDVGVDHFLYTGDGIFTGGQSYIVLGMHTAAIDIPLDDATLADFDAGVTSVFESYGPVTARRRIDGPSYLGQESVFEGKRGGLENRTVHLRTIVMRDALYLLMAAADTKLASSPYIVTERTKFFDAFHVVSSAHAAPAGPRHLDHPTTVALARRAGRFLFL